MKKWLLVLSLCPTFSWSALTVAVNGTTQTQAILAIRGYSGSCQIAVSTSPTYSPVIPDFSTEYLNSSTDTMRSDTLTGADGTRLVTAGHRTGDRALSAGTVFYYQVSGCGGPVTGSFTTANLGSGVTYSWPIPANSSNPWNYGYPQVSLLSRTSWYVDPTTGVQMKPVNLASDWSWSSQSFGPTYNDFSYISGGVGWVSSMTILNDASSTAHTSSTYTITLYGLGMPETWGGQSVDDIGVVVFGSATNTTSNNADVQICLSTNPVTGCLGTPITVTLTSTFQQANSGSATGFYPASWPSHDYSGWGLPGILGVDHQNTQSNVNCAAGVCTLNGSWTRDNTIPTTLVAGDGFAVAGSTCPNHLCTVASVQNSDQVTLNQSINISGASSVGYVWSVIANKVTPTGTITLGLGFVQDGTRGIMQGTTAIWNCNKVGFTSGDGHYGFLCIAESLISGGNGVMYFISGDGTIRPIWTMRIPDDNSCYNPSDTNDQPTGEGGLAWGVVFGNLDGKTFYLQKANQGGGSSLYQVVYSSDAGVNAIIPDNYQQSHDGNVPRTFGLCDFTYWTNLQPTTSTSTIIAQIEANYPYYSTTTFGTGFGFTDIAGQYGMYTNSYSGQNYPAALAFVNLASSPIFVTNVIDTGNGNGTNGRIMWGGHHNGKASAAPGVFELTEDTLHSGDTNYLYTGPFVSTPIAILNTDGVTWNPNTYLGPPFDGTYYATCPVNNTYAYLGAAGNNCVTIKFPKGGFCNATPNPSEVTASSCPWNAAYSDPISIGVGNSFIEGVDADREHFRVVIPPTVNADQTLTVVAERDSMPDYCCYQRSIGGVTDCAQNSGQVTHSNRWVAMMTAPAINGCDTGDYFYNAATGEIDEAGHYQQGHNGIYPGISANTYSLLVNQSATFSRAYSQLFSLPTQLNSFANPTFNSATLGIGAGTVQSYVNTPGGVPWMMDTNALNGNYGLAAELSNNTIGNTTIYPVSGNISTITVLGVSLSTTNYKTFPLLGWAGRFTLVDISSPSSSIDASPYSMCYAYNAGECHSGSLANVLYINVPFVTATGSCNTGQSYITAPCVVIGYPGGGGFRQQRIYSADTQSFGSRFLTYGMTAPGEAYPYAEAVSLPDQSAILLPGHEYQNWNDMAWLVKTPPWQEDSTPRNNFIQVPVQIPAGNTYAEIHFGYSPSLYCSPRSEVCTTGGPLYDYISEARNLTACTNGCTINIPALPGGMLYYQIETNTSNSTSGETPYGDIQTVVVP